MVQWARLPVTFTSREVLGVKPIREIPLTQGYVAIVDADDYDRVMAAGNWFAVVDHHTQYATHKIRRGDGTRTKQSLHTFLTGWGIVDHRNGDGLDNRRANLRPASVSENAMNRGLAANNTSGFKGVSRKRNRWQAAIKLDGNTRYLGMFATPEEAARAYDAAAREFFGEFARLNFPDSPRANLHLANHAENSRNARLYTNNTSGYKGVSWHKRSRQWQARITLDRKSRYLGCFATREEAARAYDAAARELHGEFARLNFPGEAHPER
jgi:hypothetical protein